MEVDRWYPTLTVLPDGHVLISSGASRDGIVNGQNRFELFKPGLTPGTGSIIPLDNIAIENDEDPPFTGGQGQLPLYPHMFVLPSGDVFYAGAYDATDVTSHGRVLVVGDMDGNGW